MDTDTAHEATAPVARSRWIVALTILLVATLGVALAVRESSTPVADTAMLQVSPGGQVELASLPTAHQSMYLAVADDPGTFREVTCYCGCESFLDHRQLLDCFVRPEGGWERHATGCTVCLGEARDVLDLRADDTPVDDIVDHIDTRFGGITPTPAA